MFAAIEALELILTHAYLHALYLRAPMGIVGVASGPTPTAGGGTPPDSTKVSSTLQTWGTVAWVAGAAFCAWGAVLGWGKFANSTNKRGEGFIQAVAGCLGAIACAGGAGWTMGLIGL